MRTAGVEEGHRAGTESRRVSATGSTMFNGKGEGGNTPNPLTSCQYLPLLRASQVTFTIPSDSVPRSKHTRTQGRTVIRSAVGKWGTNGK